MNDPINKLRGLASEIKAREDQLRAYFTDLELRLKEAAGGHSIRGQSENCLLETYGDDDGYYGYLYFDENGLRVAYRTRQEDTELAFANEPWEPTYRLDTLDKCRAVWLRGLSAPTVIESLLTSVNKRVEEDLRETKAGIDVLSATANLPLRALESSDCRYNLCSSDRNASDWPVLEHLPAGH
jgi:hypothetical protein